MEQELEVKGKSVDDAVRIALEKLHTTKENIEYEVIEESNKTLFSILSPKYAIIKVKIIDIEKCIVNENKLDEITEEDRKEIVKISEKFLADFFNSFNYEYKADISIKENILSIYITTEKSAILIGYRGEVLDSLQTILSLTVNNIIPKGIKVQIDTENYRERRKKTLEDLAVRMANNVAKSRKSITLEPMYAYERKIIHSRLQNDRRVETKSIGEEPYRKVVITFKSNY